MLYAALVIALVAADQLVKFFVRANIPLGGGMPFLPGLIELTYVQNTGAAFSILREHTWLLTLVSAVLSVLLAVMLIRRTMPHPFAMTCIAVILGGAIGNLIDRAAFGFVTDMFNVQFMNFAVFNVADICVVCGVFAFAVYILFLQDRWEKKGEGHAQHPTDG